MKRRHLEHLRNLLHLMKRRQLFLGGWVRFSRFPSFCINPSRLPSLSHLSLKVDVMEEQDLRILGALPELRYLSLNVSTTEVVCNNPTTTDGHLFQKLTLCSLEYSEVRLLLPSKDASFRMQDVSASILLGSERKDGVQELWYEVRVREFKDANDDDCGSLGLEYFISLHNIRVTIHCDGASAAEVEELEAVLRRAVDIHPNHPTLEVRGRSSGGSRSGADLAVGLEGLKPLLPPEILWSSPKFLL
ncbi:hypothetical protein C2845_PM18G12920 [Panicum miliaceum]|uniref:Disease resistance R13L4/SHOC-2-like LRR domain-containing protein n=1 Tax=Panicum miliaceum TaxID=4540 RepID=A0A3L6PJM9_PANMI|nr:hypothetical protein C2845_PM18G12920 [Panicum miliaceum]